MEDTNLDKCVFCGGSAAEVPKLLTGKAAAICNYCVGFFYDVLLEEGMEMTLHMKGGSSSESRTCQVAGKTSQGVAGENQPLLG